MAERDLTAEIQKLREDFATVQSDVAELAALLRELGAERLDDAKVSAGERLEAGRERLRRKAEAAQTRGRETVEDIGETIGGHPLGSVAMAFGIGFLVAKLLDVGSRR